jgi:hypothetical protein
MSDFNNIWKENFKLSNSKGCFFMNFKDFKHYFSKIQICKIQDNYKYQSVKLQQKLNSYSLVKMKINNENPSRTFISLSHQDKKKTNINPNDTKYFTSRFIISRLNNGNQISINDSYYLISPNVKKDEIEYVVGKVGQDRDIFDERELESGEYLIFVEIDWNLSKDSNSYEMNKSYSSVFSVYSDNDIELSLVDNFQYPEILEKIYRSCAKKQNTVNRFINEGAPNCLK